MKYLLLLLLLTACTQGKEKQQSAALRVGAADSANEVLKEMNDNDAASTVISLDNYTSEGINYNREDGVIPFPNLTISNYLNEANPYLKEYKEFFQNQLEFHGRHSENETFVNLSDLIDINIKFQFALAADRQNPEKTLIRIITNDKTNYYPLK